MKRLVLVALAAALAAGATYAALSAGAGPTPYEQVQSARKHLSVVKTEVAAADADLTAAEATLKPASMLMVNSVEPPASTWPV